MDHTTIGCGTENLFATPLVLEVPEAGALNSKTTGDSDTYTEED